MIDSLFEGLCQVSGSLASTNSNILRSRVNRLLKSNKTLSGRYSAAVAVVLLGANVVWLIGCASVAPSPPMPRDDIAGGLSLTANIDESVAPRLHKLTENLHGVAQDDGYLLAIEIKIFETSRSSRSEVLPPTAHVLDQADANRITEELESRRDVKLTSYPRMLTRQSRLVYFRSVINVPYLADSETKVDAEGNATENSSVDYVPIGDRINVLPTLLDNDRFHIAMDLNFTDLIGEQMSDEGNPYPVVSTNRIVSAFEVDNGGAIFIQLPPTASQKIKTSRSVIITPKTTEVTFQSLK